MNPETGLIDRASARELGKELHAEYNAQDPFPHCVIDDFLPESVARMCLDHFPEERSHAEVEYDRPQERLKHEYNPEDLPDPVRQLFYTFNSRPFIKVLENISGIKGLIPDPYFRGGGFHQIFNGGHLSVHADFNHHKTMNLERRINLLIYLNEDWSEDYGGQLELWTTDMSQRCKSVVPMFNRAAMFNTTSYSNHGNPQPVNHPEGRSRKSIALYYYTATWDGAKRSHTTQFRARPSTEDKTDWSVRRRELLEDFVPPIIRRQFQKRRNKG